MSFAGALLMLGGCGQGGDADPAEAGQGGWGIPAGIYGNVTTSAESGEMAGVELRLDRGSESETVEIILCDGVCDKVATRPLRRGLNGVSFTLPTRGATADVLIQPGGPDAVIFNIGGIDRLRTERLIRMERELGLAAGRSGSALE